MSHLSSGELSYILQLTYISIHVGENSLFLIDEPEISMHPRWIKGYISKLDDICSNSNCQVIIATHAPILINNVSNGELICLAITGNGLSQIKHDKNLTGATIDKILEYVFETIPTNNNHVNMYKKTILSYLKSGVNNKIETGISIFNDLEDSPFKFEIFRECRNVIIDFMGSKKSSS